MSFTFSSRITTYLDMRSIGALARIVGVLRAQAHRSFNLMAAYRAASEALEIRLAEMGA